MLKGTSSPEASGSSLSTFGTRTPSPKAVGPGVVILLCTLNGERLLPGQLASLERQTFRNWRLIASDDGSSDGTKSILRTFQESFEPGRVEIVDGPRRGAPANFLFLACRQNLISEYYAFCDQDDVWEPGKLARAGDLLEKAGSGIPALYGSRTKLIDENGNEIGFSPMFRRNPDFRRALVQSIAGGNTMVFNQKARELLVFCGADVNVPSHDWWLYQVVSGCGGAVHYDAYPSVRDRQHARNVIGSNIGWIARLRRLQMVRKARFRHWADLNIATLTRLRRARMFAQTRAYRPTLLGNLGLAAAAVLKKI
jgi:glycosyltransferase involved in cell wall biosynthesis